MSSPLLSIIVPVYNVQSYLPKCLNSILAQKYANFEIWLIDDGSTDRSGSICDEYAKRNSRVNVIHQKNAGVSHARNIALNNINGDYITFVDGDDWVETDVYQKCIAKMQQMNADMAVFDVVYWYSKTNQTKKNKNKEFDNCLIDKQSDLIKKVFRNSAWITNKIFSRRIIEGVRFDETMTYGEDVYFLLQVLKNDGITCYVTNDTGYYRLMRSGSATGGGVSKKNIEYIHNNIKMYDELSVLDCADVGIYRILLSVDTFIDRMIASKINNKKYLSLCKNAVRYPKRKDIFAFGRSKQYGKKQRIRYIMMVCFMRLFYLVKFKFSHS